MRDYLYNNHHAKSIVNSFYVYAIWWFHAITNLLPGVLRVLCFRPLLGGCGRRVFFDHGVYIKLPWLVTIGDSVVLNRGVEIYSDFFSHSKVRIGSGVRLAPHVRIHASGHELESGEFRHSGAEVIIGDNVWIGAGAMVLSGVEIGEGSVIAAGSVVTTSIPAHSLAAGVPATVKRQLPTPGAQA